MMIRKALLGCLTLLLGVGLIHAQEIGAQDIARLQSGVVKITAKPPQGTANVGTGFIVRVDKDAAYIVTAAHVVAGDTHPKVEFFTKRNLPVTAEVLGLEGDDEVRGLALLVVKGSENLPKGLTALSLAEAARLTGGEDIVVIGFPRNAGPWAIVKGNISSRQGRDIFFSPSIESGHSGGPIFQGGKVVGVVGSGNQSVGRGVTVGSVEDYIEGFGIAAQDRTSSGAMTTESSPPPAATAKPEPQQKGHAREITAKDGTSMALVPTGEFIRALVGHWRKTTIVFGNPEDENLVLHADGTAENWVITATSRSARTTGRWNVEGKTLNLRLEGHERISQPFTFHEEQLVFPNIPNQRRFWEKQPADEQPAPVSVQPTARGPVSGTYQGLAMTLLGGTSVIQTTYQQTGDQVSGTYADNQGDAGVMQGRVQGNAFAGRLASQVFPGVACDFTSEVADGGKTIQGTITCNNGNSGSFALERQ